MRTAVVALVATAAVACSDGGLPKVAVSAVPSGSAEACARFARRLPKDLGEGLPRRSTAPESPHVAAYGDPPVVIRCGAPVSPEFQTGDPLLNVNGISWFYEERPDAVVWSLPRAFVNVEVTIPRQWPGDRLSHLTDAVNAAQGV